MTITESAVRSLATWLGKRPEEKERFLADEKMRRAYMERLLDTECGAEANGDWIRFDLGCAQAVVPYAELEREVLEALKTDAE